MSSDLSASIQKLRESSSKLNDLTDQANQTIQMVEDLLRNELRISSSATTAASNRTPNNVLAAIGNIYSTELSYNKFHDKFRICVIYRDQANKMYTKPWLECSRDLKLESIRRLPELLELILDGINKHIDAAEQALSNVSGLLDPEHSKSNKKRVEKIIQESRNTKRKATLLTGKGE